MIGRLIIAACGLAGIATPALAQSEFPNTCSEIHFAYSGENPTLQAVCLKDDGKPNPTSLTLQGIANVKGRLVQGEGPSTFQHSCGNIQILANGTVVLLVAQCRMPN